MSKKIRIFTKVSLEVIENQAPDTDGGDIGIVKLLDDGMFRPLSNIERTNPYYDQ
ncbi:MAG: hypothetical protein JEZ08_15475 [Clostridiales bacterium]|nr:hypothetical protein [Clostridiales bacterium]